MSNQGLSFTDAAELVLKDSGGRPMHYAEITRIAMEKGYLKTEGQTPERTLNAMIGAENRRREARGEDARFVSHGSGYYSLAGPSKGIEREIEKHNQLTRKRLREALYEIEPDQFELLIARLLLEIGYEDIEVTSYSGDRGIDINATLTAGGVTSVKTAIQVKRHKSNIGAPVIRELRGSLGAHQRGLVITTSDFAAGAYEEAMQPDRLPISLVRGDQLVDLLIEHGIGVARKEISLITLDRETLEGEPDLAEAEGLEPPAEEKVRRAIRKPAGDGKAASIWPLPGGADQYAEALFRVLAFIVRENPTQEEVAAWFLDQFANVRSTKAIKGYLQVLRSMDLIRYDGELMKVTTSGAELAASQSIDALREILEKRILGVTEILELLKAKPATADEVHQHLLGMLNLGWKTDAQSNWRLLWLECVGAIRKEKDLYCLSSK